MWLSRNVLSRVLQCSDDRSGNDVRLPLKRSPPMGNTLLRKTFIKYVPSHILGGFPCKSLSCYWLAVLSPPDSGGGPRGRESQRAKKAEVEVVIPVDSFEEFGKVELGLCHVAPVLNSQYFSTAGYSTNNSKCS